MKITLHWPKLGPEQGFSWFAVKLSDSLLKAQLALSVP